MEKRRTQKGNGILVGVLCFLVLVIVGLVIGVVMMSVNNNEVHENESDVNNSLPKELQGDNLSPTDQVIKETTMMAQDPNISDAEIEAYYDEVVEKALGSGDSEFAAEIIIQKMNFLGVIEQDCLKAKDYVNNINLSLFSADEKAYLASYFISMAGACNDEVLQEKWNKIYNELEVR